MGTVLTPMRRKLIIAALSLLLLSVGGWLAYWQILTNDLDAGLRAWIAEQRALGWTVSVGSINRGGWSLAARLTAHDINITGEPALLAGGVAWQASAVELRISLLDPWRLTILPLGLQVIRLPNGTAVSLVAEALAVDITAASPNGVVIDFDATDLRAETQDDSAHTASIERLEAQITWLPAAVAGERAATFTLLCKGIRLPVGIRWPLGPQVEIVAAEGGITGPLPVVVRPLAAAAAWRDGGGALEIALQSLVWGPLNVTGSATLALDEELQPMGAGNAHVIGFQGTFDALGSNGVLTLSAVRAAKALLSLMAGVPGGREHQSVDVPLTLQFRTLSMRQIPLLLLPEVDWPGP